MAAIPPDWGGDHVFMVDPQAQGLSTIVADMAAINLQLLHSMHAAAADDAGRGRITALRDRVTSALDASKASHSREQATRELQPLTRLPDAPWGVNVNVAGIRMHNIPAFSGSNADTIDVVRWISRIVALAEANTLAFRATINLMVQGASGGAADYIEQMRSEGKTLNQVIQQLEMRYGELCTPEEARVKCNNMARKEGEGLPEFIDRIRLMARMACRLQRDDAARRVSIDVLVEGNIRRVLPSSVRNALEERVINRSRMGLPAFNAREIEKECLDLEKRRDERKVEARDGAHKRHGRVLKATVDVSGSESSDSSDDEIDLGDEGVHHLVNEIKDVKKQYADRGRNIDPRRVYRKAIRNYNDRFQNERAQPRYQRGPQAFHGARQAAGNPAPMDVRQGPPNKLDTSQRRTVSELLELANCARGRCIQCGSDGHYMHSDKCVLRDKVLVDRPCVKCGQGLHMADDCPKVYQKEYVANIPQPQQASPANVGQGESAALN